MVSLSPGIPGRKQQMPRTWRSIFTPACDGRVERLDTGFVDQRVHLEGQVAVAVLALALGLTGNTRQELLAHGDRARRAVCGRSPGGNTR